jgi:type IV pilus assembly protein PilB
VGKFDLDDLLKELANIDEEGAEDAASADGAALPSAAPASEPPSAPIPVRSDPRGTPRPPDLTGSGLGTETDAAAAPSDADPNRVRPDDGLMTLYRSASQREQEAALARADDLGRMLVSRAVISAEQLASAQRLAKRTPGRRLADLLVEMGVDEAQIQAVIAEIARLPFERVNVEQRKWDQQALTKLTPEFCLANRVIPLRTEGSRLVVGTTNPDDVFVLDDVKRRLGARSIKHVLVPGSDIRAVLDSLNDARATTEEEALNVDEILADVEEGDVEVVKEAAEDADESDAAASPVVRYVNLIIQAAVKEGASDIHVEPDEKTLKVRFRIDGVLFEMMNPPRKMHAALTSRIKIMANLDISERRLPQDGRIRASVLGRQIDLRVSTVPTPKGEKTVMRILDNRAVKVSLDELGFSDETLLLWKNQINQPHGIILVTGPTGSGKTTTLYASLQQLDLRRLNVSTVEDPVEYNIAHITQIQTHDRIGMTFSVALRALLRQDPDVIMVGEIRDMETATTAIQAAMTGHLVLSTLHTNDAPASITRLINIGIEPFLVAGATKSVLAQRLVRKICSNCVTDMAVTDEIAEFLQVHGLSASNLRKGSGCPKCREVGYSGRLGIYELLVVDDHLGDAIARNPNVNEFRRVCTERGMVTLREDGLKKAVSGVTTVEEILRATESTI